MDGLSESVERTEEQYSLWRGWVRFRNTVHFRRAKSSLSREKTNGRGILCPFQNNSPGLRSLDEWAVKCPAAKLQSGQEACRFYFLWKTETENWDHEIENTSVIIGWNRSSRKGTARCYRLITITEMGCKSMIILRLFMLEHMTFYFYYGVHLFIPPLF